MRQNEFLVGKIENKFGVWKKNFEKNFGCKTNFVSEKILGLKKVLGLKIFWLKNFRSEKSWGPKKFEFENLFESNEI